MVGDNQPQGMASRAKLLPPSRAGYAKCVSIIPYRITRTFLSIWVIVCFCDRMDNSVLTQFWAGDQARGV
jgi:hypothetical protein